MKLTPVSRKGDSECQMCSRHNFLFTFLSLNQMHYLMVEKHLIDGTCTLWVEVTKDMGTCVCNAQNNLKPWVT